MNARPEYTPSRKQIAIRLLYALFFILALEVVKVAVNLTVLFQYLYLFITRTPSEPVRNFGNQAAAYGYRIMRYLTLNDNARPFPFQEFPPILELPEDKVTFS